MFHHYRVIGPIEFAHLSKYARRTALTLALFKWPITVPKSTSSQPPIIPQRPDPTMVVVTLSFVVELA